MDLDPTLKTTIKGRLVELPGTIATIRAELPPDQIDAFDQQVGHTGAAELPAVLARWALKTRPDAEAEDNAMFAALAAGDFTGCVPAGDPAQSGAA